MGAKTSKPPEFNPNVMKTWTLSKHVSKVHAKYLEGNFDFGVDEQGFRELLQAAHSGCTSIVRDLFKTFDPNQAGLVHTLEVLAAMCAMSWGSVPEKIDFIFELFDFNQGGDITYDEMVILLCAALSGIVKIAKVGRLPEDPEMEMLTDEAFLEADKDANSTISKKEFMSWLHTLLDHPNPNIPHVLEKFGLKPKESSAPAPKPPPAAPKTPKKQDVVMDEWDHDDPDLLMDLGMPIAQPAHIEQSKQGAEEANGLYDIEPDVDGDKFVAIKPWMNAVKEPTEMPEMDADEPEDSLALEHVHGYRCHDCRNNVRELETGEIVYHVASLGVVLDPATNTQRIYMSHTDDITALALHPDGKTVATGQAGKSAEIHIWDTTTLKTLYVLRGFHKRAVIHLSFSNREGKLLASVGRDDNHTLALYEWASGKKKPIKAAKTDTNKILHLSFTENDKTIITCGVRHMCFWTVEGREFKREDGVFGDKGTPQPIMAAASMGSGKIFTATASGNIYEWKGSKCNGGDRKHDGCINVLFAAKDIDDQEVLVSGGIDGKIKIFNKSLEKEAEFDLNETDSFRPRVRSAQLTKNGHMIVGTRGGEIYKFADSKSLKLHEGHFDGELWALAAHPSMERYFTAGDDKVVRLWDCKTRKTLQCTLMDSWVRAACFAPDGSVIALGVGGRYQENTPKVNGAFRVLNAESLEVVFSGQECKRWITEIKYSPNGGTLAIGSADTKIYLHDTSTYKVRCVIETHSSPIAHFDFTANSEHMQSTCAGHELLYHSVKDGAHMPDGATKLRDARWHSWTCPLGWPVQGIWPAKDDGAAVNACDRTFSGDSIVTADDFGRVQLYNFPSALSGSAATEYLGHASKVTNCRFTFGDKCVVSTGGDKAVMQWRFEHAERMIEDCFEVDDEQQQDDELALSKGSAAELAQAALVSGGGGGGGGLVLEGDAGGDEFAAVKPWMGAIVGPTEVPPMDDTAPGCDLELGWVYGYQAQNMRDNVRYTGYNEGLAYSTASLGIVYTPSQHEQKFYNEQHTDDIISLAVTPDGKTVATGQIGRNACVHLWDALSTERIQTLKGHKRGVALLEFSADGTQLVSVGLDNNHTLILYDWEHAQQLARSKTITERILNCSMNRDQTVVACVAKKFVGFWTRNGKNFKKKKGIFGMDGKIQVVQCCTFAADGLLYTGQKDGTVYRWENRMVSATFKGHKGMVNSIFAGLSPGEGSADPFLLSGGVDGKLFMWSQEGKRTEVGAFESSVRSVCAKDGKYLVGTSESEIFEIKEGEAGPQKTLLVEGHCDGELWGLAMHPSENKFVTTGDDKTIRLWDAYNRKSVKKATLKGFMRAAAFSPDASYIAVGFGGMLSNGESSGEEAGSFAILNAESLEVVHEGQDSKEWVTDLKFSPNGQVLAIASYDNMIYLYDAADGFKLTGECKGHSSYVTHIDFTKDSESIQTNCGGYELLYWDIASASQKPSGAKELRDTEWDSWTCPLGWGVQGIWPSKDDGTYINAVDVSKDGRHVVTADDFGKVKLYNYPCAIKSAAFTDAAGHSSHVTNVRWNKDDDYLISIGGSDRAIMQWSLPHDPETVEAESDEDLDAEAMPHVVDDPTYAVMQGHDFVLEGSEAEAFMAIKPWQEEGVFEPPTNKAALEPVEFRNKLSIENTEDDELELEWVHGYRSFDCRNNLRYLASGEVVYPAACVAVVYDKKEHKQRHYMGHADDIVSLIVHPDGNLVASGSLGRKPEIHIWDGNSLETVCVLTGHEQGVANLEFSLDGSKLLSTWMDADSHIVLYDWMTAKASKTRKGTRSRGERLGKGCGVIGECRGAKTKMLDCCMGPNDEICVVGVKFIRFWLTDSQLNGKAKNGIFNGRGKLQVFYSCCYLANGECVVGAGTGELYVWKGRMLDRTLEAHASNVNCLVRTAKGGFVSGGKDGVAKVWDKSFHCILKIDLEDQDICSARCRKGMSPDPQHSDYFPGVRAVNAVRSVCQSDTTGEVLIGTRASEVFEVNKGDAVLLTEGHCKGELWALDMNPTKPEYVTAGDDRTVRMWDAKTRALKRKKTLTCWVRAIAYSPDGNFVAVGYGGQIEGQVCGDEEGAYRVLDGTSLDVVHKAQDSRQWIEEIKYSPDGKKLVVASHDRTIYLYDTQNSYKQLGIFAGHSGHITHLDFTKDGTHMQSTCGAHELIYWDVDTFEQNMEGGTALRDSDWLTITSPLGWGVQGIWPTRADACDITACCRSWSRRLIATADEFGRLRLFNYPCTAKGSSGDVYQGHSNHVTNCRWLTDDSHLVSTGGEDLSVFQWKLVSHNPIQDHEMDLVDEIDEDNNPAEPAPKYAKDEEAALLDDMRPSGDPRPGKEKAPVDRPPALEASNEGLEFELDADAGGDAFMAVKPWQSTVTEPTEIPKMDPGMPNVKVELDWVYGYQAQTMRGSLRYGSNGDVLYTSAGVGVAFRHGEWTQQHATHNTDEIISFATTPNGKFAATGEMGKTPKISVWDTATCVEIASLKGCLSRGVSQLCFSHDGSLLAAVGLDSDHTVAVFDWQNQRLVGKTPGGKRNILGLCFSLDDSTLYAVGVKYAAQFKIASRGIRRRLCHFARRGKIQTLMCCTSTPAEKGKQGKAARLGTIWAGGRDGSLVGLQQRKVCMVAEKLHTGAINAVYSHARQDWLITGGADGVVNMVGLTGEVKKVLTTVPSPVVSVASNHDKDYRMHLVGTSKSEVWEVRPPFGPGKFVIQDGKNFAKGGGKSHQDSLPHETVLLTEGHSSGELCGLAMHPNERRFVTAGDDKTVRVWDLVGRRQRAKATLKSWMRAAAYSPDGKHIAVGFGGRLGGKGSGEEAGSFAILNAESLEVVHEGQDSKEWVTDLKFSPNGKTLAVASYDGSIYLYDAASGGYELKGTCSGGHKSHVTHFDFSRDCKSIQSTCGGFELLYWDVASASQKPNGGSDLRDAEWDSQTCTLGWPVQGAWPGHADGSELSSLGVSGDERLVAVGDDFGRVRVFNYPCVQPGAAHIQQDSHAMRVTNVAFEASGGRNRYLVSTGGLDRAAIQYKITPAL